MANDLVVRDWKTEAQEYAASEPVAMSNSIRVRGGVMFFNDTQIPGNRLIAVVVDTIRENSYFVGKFDPDVPQAPQCYALARDEKEMGPHPSMQADLTYFKPQNATCKGCPMNEWGTAAQGKGKACQNRRRLYLIPAGQFGPNGQIEWFTDPNHYRVAEIALMRLPVTSVKNWSNYAQNLAANLQRPPWAVATGIAVLPDPKSQWKITFDCLATLPDNVADAIHGRRDTLLRQEIQGYQPPSAQESA